MFPYTDLYVSVDISISTCRLSNVSTYPVNFDLLLKFVIAFTISSLHARSVLIDQIWEQSQMMDKCYRPVCVINEDFICLLKYYIFGCKESEKCVMNNDLKMTMTN